MLATPATAVTFFMRSLRALPYRFPARYASSIPYSRASKRSAFGSSASGVIRGASSSPAESAYQACRERLSGVEGRILSLQELLKKAEQIDREALLERQANLTAQKKALNDKQTALHSRLSANRSALEHVTEKASELETLEKKLTWVKALSDTVNGNLNGKKKVMLETYVQMTYFDRIIARANTRFMIMSGGQYELKRRMEAENK